MNFSDTDLVVIRDALRAYSNRLGDNSPIPQIYWLKGEVDNLEDKVRNHLNNLERNEVL